MGSVDSAARTQALKRSIQNLCDAGARKTTFFPLVAQSLQRTVGEPRQIRRAKAFAHLLDQVDLAVLPFEKLGGSILGMWPVEKEPSYEEQLREAFCTIENEIKAASVSDAVYGEREKKKKRTRALMARDHYNASISFAAIQKIIKAIQKEYAGSDQISPQAIAKSLEDHFVFQYGEDVTRLIEELPWAVANHLHLNYGFIINTGYKALLQKITGLLARAKQNEDVEKAEFYTAAKISIEAAICYIQRYAEAYQKAAMAESDTARAAELREIAGILRAVSTEKASSFREAMQLMWVTHIIANTALGSALSFARFDQYMLPFYKADKEAGKITDDEALELIAHMILKVNEPKMRTVQSLALGGTTPDGKNAANDLTRITLEAAREVRMPYPNISLRVARALTPEWVYDEAVETIKMGFGMPMLVNDDVWVKNFMSLGYPAAYARDYYNMGCVEMMIQNRQAHWIGVMGSSIAFPNILERILADHASGKIDMDTFDDILAEMKARIKAHVKSVGGEQVKQYIEEMHKHAYDPFGSALIYNCLDKGRDMYHQGSQLPAQVILGHGARDSGRFIGRHQGDGIRARRNQPRRPCKGRQVGF
jgi:formate C-acetyltransferase